MYIFSDCDEESDHVELFLLISDLSLGLVLLGFGCGYATFLTTIYIVEWRRRRRLRRINNTLPTELQNTPELQLETAKQTPVEVP